MIICRFYVDVPFDGVGCLFRKNGVDAACGGQGCGAQFFFVEQGVSVHREDSIM